jgi:hypothetical protein
MNNKPDKSPPEDSKKADVKVDSDHSVEKKGTKNTLRPVREGPENLRQRADWFRRRTGGDR